MMARAVSGIARQGHCTMESQQNNNIGHWLRIVVAPSYSGGAHYEASSPRHRPAVPLTIGEVHTGLLLTSTAVSAETAEALLAILPGGSVRTRQRPVRYAWSPEVLTGVDCFAPIAGRREVRVVGTPATQVSLTDGHIVQARTYATLRYEPAGRRRPWAHYLAQPGVLEVLGSESEEKLATGFLSGPTTMTTLDLGAVSLRALSAVQRN